MVDAACVREPTASARPRRRAARVCRVSLHVLPCTALVGARARAVYRCARDGVACKGTAQHLHALGVRPKCFLGGVHLPHSKPHLQVALEGHSEQHL